MKIYLNRNQLFGVIYFIILVFFPFTLWVIPNRSLNMTVFLLLGIFCIFSKYLSWLQKLYPIMEILFLFLAVNRLLEILGLSIFFPVNHLLTLILFYAFVIKLRKFNRSALFLRPGLIAGNYRLATIFTVLALTGLTWWFRELAANPYAHFIPDLPVHFLLPLGIGFALINSLYEEGIFRSIFLGYLDQLFQPWIALVLQGVWFSFLHYQSGFPAGVTGMVMTYIFAIMMGVLVRRTRGLLLAIVIHAIADFWIFLLIVMRIHGRF